jgi:hypothetical protein
MNIQVRLRVEGKEAAAGTIHVDDRKLEELTEEEVERALELIVSQWANDRIEIEWDADDSDELAGEQDRI